MNLKGFLYVLVFALIANGQLVFGEEDCGLPGFFSMKVSEDIPEGELIKTIVDSAVEGSILRATGSGATYFKPELTGKILNLRVIKSIHKVPDGDDAQIKLDLEIFCNKNKEDKTSLTISIQTVNDHAPLFNSTDYTANIQEMMSPGFIISTDKQIIVSDQDTIESENYDITVTIEEGNFLDTFEIETKDITTTKVRKIEVFLKTKKTVEMPKDGYYDLLLRSNDNNAKNPLTSSARVKIYVKQLDLKDPIFKNPSYNGDLYFEENSDQILVKDHPDRTAVALIGSNKLKLESIRPAAILAFDQDLQIDTPLKYELVAPNEQPDWTKYFELVNTSLSLVKVDPAFLKEKSINLLMKASQIDDSSRMALAMISLKIHLPDSKTPYFTQRVEILRRTKKDAKIYTIEVENNDDVNIKIDGDKDYFSLVGQSLFLKQTIPDSVTKLTLVITVETKSKLGSSINNVKVIFDVVTVKTIQDPLFEKKIYNLDIWKDLKVGEEIFKLVPLETDVVYENIKQSPDTGTFKFDETNGKITLAKNPTEKTYTINIEGQTDDSTDTTEIRINVIEPKPKPDPLFKTQKQSVQITSDHKQNVEFFKLETNFPGIHFEYTDQTEELVKKLFQLDNKSGGLSLISPLENQEKQYSLFIRGSLDSTNGKREEVNEVVIKVLKKLDPPTSLFKKSIYRFDLMSDIQVKEEIFKINTEANVITKIENITPDNGQTIFTLSTDGQITLSGALHDKTTQYKLFVLGSKENREERAEVWIDIVKKMDPPSSLFQKSIYSLDLMSDTKLGAIVYTITTNNADVTMELESSSPVFSLSTNGQITLSGPLDPKINQYKLKVSGRYQKRTEETEVVIHLIEKLKPASPLFEKSIYRTDILSDTEKDKELIEIATNADKTVTVELSNDTPENIKSLFKIVNNKLVLNGKLDSGVKEYKLKLFATSQSQNENAEAIITVVERIKPPTPLFTKSIYRADILSNTENKELIEINTNPSNGVTMEILNVSPESAKSLFRLDQNKLILIGKLEKNINEYKLTVKATVDSLSEEAEVILTIVKKLEPPVPIFTKSAYRTDILSDTEKDKQLIEIETSRSKDVTMQISNVIPETAKSLFRLDQNKLILIGTLEKNTNEYKLIVKATVDSLSEEAEVILTIVKKLEPIVSIFTKSVYRTDILSDTEKDKPLIEIETNKIVAMKIVDVSPVSAKSLFRLDENKIILNAALESGTKEYKLEIEGVADEQIERVEVYITVVDKLVSPDPIFGKSITRADISLQTENNKQLIAIETNRKDVAIEILSVNPASAESLFKVVGNQIFLNGKLSSDDKGYQLIIEGTADTQSDKAEVIFEVVNSEDWGLLDQSEAAYLVQVPEGNKIDDIVFQIKANEKASFKVVGGDTEYFKVDNTDGTVTLAKELNLLYYNLSVLVESTDNPPKAATAHLLFEVNLKRPLAVVFKKDINQLDVPIDTPAGNNFYELDMVKNANWKVQLSITGGKDKDTFEITNDGALSLINTKLEAGKQYDFEVTATVVTKPRDLIDITKVIVHGVSVKRPLTPIFDKSQESVDIIECVPKGTVVNTLSSTLIKDVRFEVKGGDTDIFQIDAIKGEVILKGNLKKNETLFLEIEALKEDLTDKTKVIFQVVASEKCLLFTERNQFVDVPPNTQPGTTVHTLETREPERPVTFEINDGDISFFHINESSGEITTAKVLEEKEYVIKVKGLTETDPVITDTIKILFHVRKCDTEKYSLFTKPVFSVEVNSTATVGDTLILDTIKPNGVTAKYFLIEDNEDFNLTENGDLILTTSPDKLGQYFYFLKIGANETSLDLQLNSGELIESPVIEHQALIIVRNNLYSFEKTSLFTKAIYSVQIDSFTPINTNLNLETIKPEGSSTKYFLRTETDKFSLTDDGQLTLITNPNNLKQPFYFLVVRTLGVSLTSEEHTSFYDASELPGIKNDEALIIVETFILTSPLVKVMLPDANLQEYVFDIKAIAPKGELVFSVEKNSYFAIDERDGQLYPIDDVTKVKQRYFKLKVSARRGNLRSELIVEIIRLNKEEVIVFNAPEVKDLTSLESKLENATSMKIVFLQYELIAKPVNYAYSNYNNYQIRFAVAAFEDENLSSPITVKEFENKTKTEQIANEIADAVGEGFETSSYSPKGEESVSIYKYKDPENGGLIAAVASLSVLLCLFLIVAVGFILLGKYKPHILEKIRSRFQKDKTTVRNEKRNSVLDSSTKYKWSNSYENYGGDLTDSFREGDKSKSQVVNEIRFDVTKEPSNIPSIKRDKDTIQRQELALFKYDERETTNHPDSYQNWDPMADNEKPTGSTSSISPSAIEKEDETDDTKKESLLQVPVDHHQLPQNPEEIEPDYPDKAEALKPDVKPRIRGVPREDSFGSDLEETPQKNLYSEVPEAFNNDLIDEEDVDTGEPGGTPHVHRKHVEIHVEEDISDEEEEEMIRKMAAIPQRKSVVTFSDKTELIP